MRFELGINNCFAVKRWPRPDEWVALVREELGLSLVQHSLDLSPVEDAWVSEATRIRDLCGQAGLRIHSVFTGLSAYSRNLMLAPDAAERARGFLFWEAGIRFTSALGARSFGGHVGSLSRRDADDPKRRDQLWDELTDGLDRLSGRAREHGLEALLVENMASEREPWQMSELRSLLSPAGGERAAVRLCLDVGHQCAPGAVGDEADPYAWLSSMGSLTDVVHLQQSNARGDHHWPFTDEFNAQGRIRADRVLDALVESGAEEMALILEVIPPFEADDAQVLAGLRDSVGYWRQALDHHAQAATGGTADD